ncbi:hypothetical protein K7711_11495 [Nocardia sp. CA2R105]|uniref:hypothetical protein n=1 Tax=Nocardia coffeae TaxID=2873381 RepID=UPI001CA60B18|nr:hypothetical protein [Nocardia coffeae]MBY8857103.1 hypothetical protein [Nocardia coffeae]
MRWSDDRVFESCRGGDMEPVSLGIAAAALLASKFGEGFAKDAGGSAWKAVERLREVVAAKLHIHPGSGTATTTVETTPSAGDPSTVAAGISAVAAADPRFAAEVERLVTVARQDRAVDVFVAQAFDQARQVNIRGDNVGTINLA